MVCSVFTEHIELTWRLSENTTLNSSSLLDTLMFLLEPIMQNNFSWKDILAAPSAPNTVQFF